MKKRPLISIIIPIYNSEKYLDRCIESIVNQTYKNLEIILINDGSSDNCPKICDAWAKKDNRIKVIHKENEGVSIARNIGINNSKGEYITFIDSDDYIDSKMYEKMLEKLNNTDTKLCFCDINIVNFDQTITKFNFNNETIITKKDFFETVFNNNAMNFAVWNKLISRKLIGNIRFDSNIYIREDALFLFECIEKIDKICYLNECLYFYQMDSNSTLHQNNIRKMISSLDATAKMIEILKNNQINNYLEEQCNYICRFYKYKSRLEEEKIKIDLSKYEQHVKEYLNDNLLSKNIGLKNRIKVLMATRLNNMYSLFIKIKDRMR